MCIICNLTKPTPKFPDEIANSMAASRFLGEYENARTAMKKAVEAMLQVSKVEPKYDRAHKRMAALLRDWNRIEQEREQSL